MAISANISRPPLAAAHDIGSPSETIEEASANAAAADVTPSPATPRSSRSSVPTLVACLYTVDSRGDVAEAWRLARWEASALD